MYLLIFYRPPVQKSLMNRLLILNFTLKILISLCWYSMNWFTILKPHCLQEVIFKMRRGLVTFTSLIYFSLSCSRISMVIFPAKYQERNFKSNTCNEHTDSTQNSDRSMDVPFQEIIFFGNGLPRHGFGDCSTSRAGALVPTCWKSRLYCQKSRPPCMKS